MSAVNIRTDTISVASRSPRQRSQRARQRIAAIAATALGCAVFLSGPVTNATAAGNSVNYYPVAVQAVVSSSTSSQLQSIQQNLHGDLDSMNEMSEMTSMYLQMAMDAGSSR